MSRFPIRSYKDAAAAAAEGPATYVRCEATSPEGIRCVYGTTHSAKHSWEKDEMPEMPESWKRLEQEREAQVETLVDVIERLCPMTADQAAELDKQGRDTAAWLAGIAPASDEVWELIISRLREHESRKGMGS